MPFLLIGGHAVNAYGIQRQTGDIDLLILKSQRDAWNELLVKMRYASDQFDDRFMRYRPDTIAAWPIDLMLVEDETFRKMYEDARPINLGSVTVKVVSPRHLLVLKLHALKVYQEHRYAKDFNDALQLLRHACSDISDEDLRGLCGRYADLSICQRLIEGRR